MEFKIKVERMEGLEWVGKLTIYIRRLEIYVEDF